MLLNNVLIFQTYLAIKGCLIYLTTVALRHGMLGCGTKAANWTVWQRCKNLVEYGS